MRKLKMLPVIATLVTIPSLAFGFQAWNRHTVNPLQGGVFEVVSEVGSGAADYWCAAGDYAIRVLRTSATQRIYIWSPVAPALTQQGRRGVQFSLQPPQGANTDPGYSLSVRRAGDNLRASSAQNYCYDRFDIDEWDQN
ncbi:MAG: hypothetical protein GJ676_20445 [Rhodobacteraceae bacterium]|nr:hypothetical protein [Paracoccaceae bacterium]